MAMLKTLDDTPLLQVSFQSGSRSQLFDFGDNFTRIITLWISVSHWYLAELEKHDQQNVQQSVISPRGSTVSNHQNDRIAENFTHQNDREVTTNERPWHAANWAAP